VEAEKRENATSMEEEKQTEAWGEGGEEGRGNNKVHHRQTTKRKGENIGHPFGSPAKEDIKNQSATKKGKKSSLSKEGENRADLPSSIYPGKRHQFNSSGGRPYNCVKRSPWKPSGCRIERDFKGKDGTRVEQLPLEQKKLISQQKKE